MKLFRVTLLLVRTLGRFRFLVGGQAYPPFSLRIYRAKYQATTMLTSLNGDTGAVANVLACAAWQRTRCQKRRGFSGHRCLGPNSACSNELLPLNQPRCQLSLSDDVGVTCTQLSSTVANEDALSSLTFSTLNVQRRSSVACSFENFHALGPKTTPQDL